MPAVATTSTETLRPQQKRALRWSFRALAVFGLLFVLGLGGARLAYPGLTDALFAQLRDGGIEESLNIARAITYWAEELGTLRWNPVRGQWDLPASTEGDETLQRQALRAFHRGDFAGSVKTLKSLGEENAMSREQLFWLALAHMRSGEARNCLAALHGEVPAGTVCTLPLTHLHSRSEGSREAARIFGKLSEQGGGDRELLTWLQAFSRLTLGERPENLRNPELEAFLDLFYGEKAAQARRKHGELAFVDRARELGVAKFDAGKGVAVEDFDGDGDLDLITGGTFSPLHYYQNLHRGDPAQEGLPGDGFREITGEVGLSGVRQSQILTAADYDNDGRVDLFVGSLLQPDRLFRNEAPEGFRDVTEETGLALDPGLLSFTWSSAWGDLDLDGDLDLFIASWGAKTPGLKGVLATPRVASGLYLNENGRFEEVSRAWGLGEFLRDGNFIGAAFGDSDGDGDTDLYLSSPMQGRSALWRNEGDRFELEQRFGAGFLAAFLDVDHDGQLEILHTGLADARTSTRKAVFGQTLGVPTSGRNLILRRTGEGSWQADESFFENELPMGTMGASFGDLDNDGCHDFYFGTGDPEPWFVLPNLMFRGRREGRRCVSGAANISMLQGFGSTQKGHGIVFFDFDEDGDQDIYSSLGGMWPADRWPNQLFVNESHLEHRWIKIRLRGRISNRQGIGSRIRVLAHTASGDGILRTYHMNPKTSFGSSPLLAHIGLGEAAGIDYIEVDWPASGCRHRYAGELGRLHVLDEAACGAARVPDRSGPSDHIGRRWPSPS